MPGLRSIGWRMFRWRSKRRVISVTRRHIEFLFGTCKESTPFLTRSEDMPNSFAQVQARAVERIIKRNREETVVSAQAKEPQIRDCACGQDHAVMPTDQEWDGERWFEYELVCRTHKRHLPCRRCLRDEGFYDRLHEEGAWQLPPSDESKVGLD